MANLILLYYYFSHRALRNDYVLPAKNVSSCKYRTTGLLIYAVTNYIYKETSGMTIVIQTII